MLSPDELLKRACFFGILLLLGATHPLVAQDEASTEKFQCKQLMEIMDAVIENHIDPPTKQQMILSGVRALYTSREHVPADLSASALSTLDFGVGSEGAANLAPPLLKHFVLIF